MAAIYRQDNKAVSERYPIWAILRHQGRNLKWLASRTGDGAYYVRSVSCGLARPTPEFQERCAKAMDLPVSLLFGEVTAPTETVA